ncbi:hypothetical protein FOA52_011334 [Chlamydomonas sp. UWO 241]|nr:hypothetical protein FOA52_011334 [Chlamydomonas sp. UWO 241]
MLRSRLIHHLGLLLLLLAALLNWGAPTTAASSRHVGDVGGQVLLRSSSAAAVGSGSAAAVGSGSAAVAGSSSGRSSSNSSDRTCNPCWTDDDAGQDAVMCHLPAYDYGTEADANICGVYLQSPANVRRAAIQATVSGVTQTIGTLLSYMTISGTWYGTILLTCPWMMIVDASIPNARISFNVTNSGSPGTTWTKLVTANDNTGVKYRTCTTFEVPGMDSPGGCTPNTITMTVSFLAETTVGNIDGSV